MPEALFFICLPIIAFLYAAVGHGGASGYLALMSIFSYALLDPSVSSFGATDIKTVALTLNLFVAGIAFFQFYRSGYFKFKIFIPLACASIPLAYLGGRIQLNTQIYFYALAVFLLFASLRLLFFTKELKVSTDKTVNIPLSLLLGGAIGFASGLLGIGGGILLSPLLLLLGWSNTKTTAAVSALFIFVNSLAGLLGQASTRLSYPTQMPWIILLVIVGGFLGSYLGANRLPTLRVKQLLAAVLLLASIKIFLS